MAFTFPAMVASDARSNQVVRNVSFQVYAVTDTTFSTPLALTDTFNNPLPGNILNSGTQGVFPQFQQATNSTVVITDATHVYAWTVNCVQQDTATAAFINTVGTATQTALNATYAPVSGSANYLAASQKGAASGVATLDSGSKVPAAQVPDLSATYVARTAQDSLVAGVISQADSSTNVVAENLMGGRQAHAFTGAEIQAKINDAASRAVSNNLKTPVLVYLQAGEYTTSSTITQPPYVKVVTLGPVIVKSTVASGTAWWIAPLATDPTTLNTNLQKQQWLRGSLIDASCGGMTLVNMTGSTSDGSVGLELGARSDLGSSKPMARYTVNDVAVQGYNVGLHLNDYQHYIAHYRRLHIENNTINVRVGNISRGGVSTNSGENFNFIDCIIAGASYGFSVNTAAFDINLYGCSLDFLGCAVLFNYGYNKFTINGGHIENINDSRSQSDGAIFNSAVGAGYSGPIPEATIAGMVPFVCSKRQTYFIGRMNLNLALDFRNNGDYTNVLTDQNVLCDSSVSLRSAAYSTPTGGPNVLARAVNYISDPVMTVDPVSTASSALTCWQVSSTANATATVDSAGPRSGSQSLNVQFTAANAYHVIMPKGDYLPVRAGERVYVTMACKASNNSLPTLTYYVEFFDASKRSLVVSNSSNFSTNPTTAGWLVGDASKQFTVPPGAVYARPRFSVSSAAYNAGVTYNLTDFTMFIA